MVRVAEILASGLGRHLATHRVSESVAKACRMILACRTAALGGHVIECEKGHVVGVAYNACRNRSCPRCAFYRVQKWLERQVKTLLGCPHHHIIFTIPHDLNVLWLLNYRVLGDLLFKSAAAALFTLAADPKHLGARPGAVMALHTWGQQLYLHPHVHCLVTAGGADALGRWVASRRAFLPAEPLKQLFRAKFLYGLRKLARQDRLRLPDGWTREKVQSLCRRLETKRWNVRVCERYEDSTAVLNYLGRYLHGGPIGERRLSDFDGSHVTFTYKDYRDQGPDGPKQKTMVLGRDEFIRRYVQHVPPKGFHLVRACGLYRHGGDAGDVRRALRVVLPEEPRLHDAIMSRTLPPPPTDDQRTECPVCGSRDLRVLWCPSRGAPESLAA